MKDINIKDAFLEHNKILLAFGLALFLLVWVIPIIMLLAGYEKQNNEESIFLFAWPIIYAVVLLFSTLALNTIKGNIFPETTKHITVRQRTVLGYLLQICCLLGLPLTMLLAYAGMLAKGI
jgi:cytosine/uracil/thiamine/allantoin permease